MMVLASCHECDFDKFIETEAGPVCGYCGAPADFDNPNPDDPFADTPAEGVVSRRPEDE